MIYSVVSLVLAVATTWAILSPDVDDGIIIKFGLCLIAVGAYGSASLLVRPSPAAHIIIMCGIVVCIVGVALKARRRCLDETDSTTQTKR